MDADDDNRVVDRPGLLKATGVDAHVGRRVRIQRISLSMTAEHLGHQVGASPQQIDKYERGINRINASRLYLIAVALGESADFFFEGLGDAADGGTIDASSSIIAEIKHIFTTDPRGRLEAMALANSFSLTRNAEWRQATLNFVKILAPLWHRVSISIWLGANGRTVGDYGVTPYLRSHGMVYATSEPQVQGTQPMTYTRDCRRLRTSSLAVCCHNGGSNAQRECSSFRLQGSKCSLRVQGRSAALSGTSGRSILEGCH